MIFQGKIINNLVLGRDTEVWEGSDIIPFLFAETIQNGYADINTITLISKFGDLADNDYKFVRDPLKQFVLNVAQTNLQSNPNNLPTDPSTLTPNLNEAWEIGEGAVGDWLDMDEKVAIWNGVDWDFVLGDSYVGSVEEYGFTFLTPEEQKICATKLIGTVTQQIQAFGIDINNPTSTPNEVKEKSKAQGQYKKRVRESRVNRYNFIANDILQNIPQIAVEVLGELGQLPDYYKEHGVDGFPIDEFDGDKTNPSDIAKNTGLSSYILGEAGFVGGGLINKVFTPINEMTKTEYIDYIVDKLFWLGLNGEEEESIEI